MHFFNQKTTEQIINTVSEFTGVTDEQMKSKKRNRTISDARKLAIKLLHAYTPLTWKEIGSTLSIDHSSALCAIKAADDLIETNQIFRNSYLNASRKLQQILDLAWCNTGPQF